MIFTSNQKSLCAGLLIGLGSLVNLSVGGGWLGAFLFSFGLLAICLNSYQLVTGQFGNLYHKKIDIYDIISMFCFNLIGVFIMVLIGGFATKDNSLEQISVAAQKIVANRANLVWYQHIAAGMICGICIQIAVQQKHQPLGIILPVMVFILTGAEHCIADSFYYTIAGKLMVWRNLLQIFEVFFGNALGALLVCHLSKDE